MCSFVGLVRQLQTVPLEVCKKYVSGEWIKNIHPASCHINNCKGESTGMYKNFLVLMLVQIALSITTASDIEDTFHTLLLNVFLLLANGQINVITHS